MLSRKWGTYWKPSSNSMFSLSLQFLRQSAAIVPGPVWMIYSEKVTSSSVLVASICTSAVPAGQPEPNSETPTIRTFCGTTVGTFRARGEATSLAGAAATRGAKRKSAERAFIAMVRLAMKKERLETFNAEGSGMRMLVLSDCRAVW